MILYINLNLFFLNCLIMLSELNNIFLNFLIGSIFLSLLHSIIPNHWVPIVMLGKSENWKKSTMVKVTLIAGFSHTLSTIILGILIGIIGLKLSESLELISTIIAPSILITIGIVYIILNIIEDRKLRKIHNHTHIDENALRKISKRPTGAIIFSLTAAMFFSPCIEIEAYFFTAGTIGLHAILTLALIYLSLTMAGMIVVVLIARKGIDTLGNKLHFLEHNAKTLTGIILIIIGLISFYIHH